MRYPIVATILLIVTVVWLSSSSSAQTKPGPGGQDVGAAGNPKERKKRIREGTELEKLTGRFENTGDRITFYPSGGLESMRVLENLALERVARELTGLTRDRQWRIAGTVTEYQGSNFLLVTRAVLQRETGP